MSDKCESVKLRKKQMLPITSQQGEKLETWILDFQDFFHWKVKVTDRVPTMVVEVIANSFIYTIVARENYLGCIAVEDNKAGACRELIAGGFSFHTFAHLLTKILWLESSFRGK